MSAYYGADSSFISKRLIALVAIIVLHLLVIYAFATGLAQNAGKAITTIIQTTIIQQDKPKELPPPPPPVDLKQRPPVQVVAPEININVPADTPPPPITLTTTRPVPRAAPRPAPRADVRTAPTGNFAPISDYYPAASIRAGEEGRPVVNYCVSAAGKLTSVTVADSSGFPRLDEAAVSLVRATRRIKPGTLNGKPVDACRQLAVKFELKGAGGF